MIECTCLSIVEGLSDQLSTHPWKRQRMTGGEGGWGRKEVLYLLDT